MKRILSFILVICAFSILTACSNDTPASVQSESVKLSAENAQMAIGDTITLGVENYFGTSLTWKSSDNSIATVDDKGNVTARGIGSAAITAKTEADTISCLITVAPSDSAITSISLHSAYNSEPDVTLNAAKDASIKLVAETTPASNGEVLAWKSENALIAEVDQSGIVTAKGNGRTNIVVTAKNGVSGSCIVRVKGAADVAAAPSQAPQQSAPSADGTIPTSSGVTTTQIMISDTTLFLEVADIKKIDAIAKGNISDVTISWSSSAPSVAVVDANGKVVAVGSGLAVISAVSSDGAVSYCQVAVGRDAQKALRDSQTAVE